MNWKRWLLYLGLNAIVSATVMISIMLMWDLTRRPILIATSPSPSIVLAADVFESQRDTATHTHANHLRSEAW